MAAFPGCQKALERDLGAWAASAADGSAAAGLERLGERAFRAWLVAGGSFELAARLELREGRWEATELAGPWSERFAGGLHAASELASRVQSKINAASSGLEELWCLTTGELGAALDDPEKGPALRSWDEARAALFGQDPPKAAKARP